MVEPASEERGVHAPLLAAERASLARIRSREIMLPRIASRRSGEVPGG